MYYAPRYIQETLLESEKLIYFTRPHWVIYVPGLLVLVIALLLCVYTPDYLGLQFNSWISMFAFAMALYQLITAYIAYRTSEYGITDKRVIMKTGWVRRHSLEIFIRRLEGVDVNQTIPGRLLDYGTLVVTGMGGTRDFYTNVPKPLEFRRYVQEQMSLLANENWSTKKNV